MSVPRSSPFAPPAFPHTRWSVVLAARQSSPEADCALEEICRAYWSPLYAYIRRCGQSPHDAQDLTQEFFHRLIAKRWLDTVDRERGKLRTFLIVALKHFMAKEWRHSRTRRQGGGQSPIPLDTALAESRLAADTTALTPDETFDQQWALTLLARTLDRLQAQFVSAGRGADLEALRDCLMATRGSLDYAVIARRLGQNEGATRVAVHRLRKQFREIYRDMVAQTLDDGADVETELRHLAAALARSSGQPR